MHFILAIRGVDKLLLGIYLYAGSGLMEIQHAAIRVNYVLSASGYSLKSAGAVIE